MPAKQDVVVIQGLTADDYSPRGLEAVTALRAEVQALRRRVGQLEAENAALAHLADQDPLMPVVNRRAFLREVTRQIAHGRRNGEVSSVLYIDLDQMKRINDRFGHAAGDAALTHVGRLLLTNVRQEDAVGRIGGDEFGVLLVGSGEAAAAEKARSLAFELCSHPFEWCGTRITLSASIGVHEIGEHESADDVLVAADMAMYRAKHAARLAEALTQAAS